jgi:3-phosphoshikimate 1-carboxyvinyltransferase
MTPARAPVRGRIRPPGSKSITNRALVCAALARGTSTLTGALDSEDTRVMIESLGVLAIPVERHDDGRTLVVHGCSGELPAPVGVLFVGNSGTTIRFLTALCSLGKDGMFELEGVPRMHERPIGDLADALTQLGASIQTESPGRCPPVVIGASGLRGGRATVRGDISSQFLSAVLMAAPYAAADVEIVVEGALVSRPYVRMTLRMMESFGGRIEAAGDFSRFHIPAPQVYQAREYAIEPDASAASYFWAAAAITGGEVTVDGLAEDSLQGDVEFVRCLARMGCNVAYGPDSITVSGRATRGIDVDMNAISDTVQTLSAVALFAEGPTTIRGVAHIRHKETDRIGDLARELRKFGAAVEEFDDGLRITPAPLARSASESTIVTRSVSELPPIEIATYHDHRMAMSLALPGLVRPGVTILDPGCTAKTYPHYFRDLNRLLEP